jgi:Uma2 family endonuclease
MVTARAEAHHWTREEYEQLVEAGAFDDWKIELVEGVLYDMTPQSARHSGAVQKVLRELQSIVSANGLLLRPQMPLAVSGESLPEPDVAVVPDDPEGDLYSAAHPSRAMLVVEVAEVADSSLRYDREVKGPSYSLGGVPEYWIVNLLSSQLEVYRDPSGDRYTNESVFTTSDKISPLFAPGTLISVSKLFPKR